MNLTKNKKLPSRWVVVARGRRKVNATDEEVAKANRDASEENTMWKIGDVWCWLTLLLVDAAAV